MKDQTVLHQKSSEPPKDYAPTRTICQYWSPQNCSCLLVTAGLFIPLPNHLVEYCHSVNFSKCPYYLKLLNDSKISDNERRALLNQRRAQRVFKYLDFQFSRIIKKDFFQSIQYETAWTTDINGYGVSFISKKYITPETHLRFLIEDNAFIPVTDGFGKVVWCRVLPATSYFQTGMEFSMLCS